MSVVAQGPLAGARAPVWSLRPGPRWWRGFFAGRVPAHGQMIDAADHLSVQVHPGRRHSVDFWGAGALARPRVLGDLRRWCLFQGTRPGCQSRGFRTRLVDQNMAATLNRFEGRAGDVSLSRAAYGATPWAKVACSTRFSRHQIPPSACTTGTAWAWTDDRGRLRTWPSHSRPSISPALGFGPLRPAWRTDSGRRDRVALTGHLSLLCCGAISHFCGGRRCASDSGHLRVVTCIDGAACSRTDGGALPLVPLQTALLPAACGGLAGAQRRGHGSIYWSPRLGSDQDLSGVSLKEGDWPNLDLSSRLVVNRVAL